jgi:hypothetical protein
MKIHIQYDIRTNTTKVYATGQFIQGQPRFYYVLNEGRLVAIEYKSGDEVQPLFEVEDRTFLSALAREITSVMPVEEATAAHLRDAMNVRDRLLTMLEGGTNVLKKV